jgi:hypothetical protein
MYHLPSRNALIQPRAPHSITSSARERTVKGLPGSKTRIVEEMKSVRPFLRRAR